MMRLLAFGLAGLLALALAADALSANPAPIVVYGSVVGTIEGNFTG